MPIKPPNLDDRQYADILEEMMQLIPQYCPEWTNLGPADPGDVMIVFLVTEMVLYQSIELNKTYIHFKTYR